MKKIIFLLLFLCSFSLFSCRESNRFKINVNKSRVNVDIKRFDKDLISIAPSDINEGVKELYNKYPDFFPLYVESILSVPPSDTTRVTELIDSFLTDSVFQRVNNDVQSKYDDIGDIEKSISTAYTYIHHYFPQIHLPEVYFFVSGFNLSIMMEDEIAGMGVDMYLGSDYPLYQDLTYRYMVNSMKRDNLAPDLISALLFSTFRMDSGEGRLLDNMLYRGKVMYLLSVCMPDEKPGNLIGYTPEQIKWSESNERKVWASIIDQKHLFSTDSFLIRKYVIDAPFTSPISQESPGRLGTWMGWQIIKSYMQNNKNVTLQELMKENDYQKVLEESGYRP
ncbi:hypothetical protein D0T49_07480 [Paludibacter sp. 221]|nr:hypothetical protein [Paludibacter sp. 221]